MSNVAMILTNEYGPDVRVYKEAKYLISIGHKVTILCWDRGSIRGLPKDEVNEGIHIIRYKIDSEAGSGKKQLIAFFRFIKKCRKYLTLNEYDYLHCHDIDGAITGYVSNKKKRNMIFDMHEFYEHGHGFVRWIWRKLTIFLLHKSQNGICVNDVYFSKAYSSIHSKLKVLKNYPDKSFVHYIPKKTSSVLRIGYHGAVRGQIPEFSALFEAVKGMEDVRVDINGGGPIYKDLKAMATQYQNVYVNGPFDGTKDLLRLYQNTDVLFCAYNPNNTNSRDGTAVEPVKFFEAILTGTPLIATESIYVGEQVKTKKYGIACDTRSPMEIRNAVLKFIENPELLGRFAENELKQSGEYDWNKAVTVLGEIYE